MKKVIAFLILILCLSSWQAYAQERTIKGKVSDGVTSEPLIGVTVVAKGSSKASITNIDGEFSLSIGSKDSIIQFSFIGYVKTEMAVNGSTSLEVLLKPEIKNIDEVVVIGYGSVKKSDATGSVTTVSTNDFNRGTVVTPENLISGKSAGVVITSNSGAPGVASTIRIRGGSSISASNDPLIVIDGVPVENNIGGSPGGMSTINPNDIESFTILKDASATAIYGSRASGGVILITTKRGTSKFKVSYNTSLSVATIPKLVDVLSGDEFRTELNKRYATNKAALALVDTFNTDWQKEIYKNAFSQDHNLGISGTAKNMPYRASLGYTNQDGVLKTTNFERTTLTLGLDPSLFDDHLKINLNVKGMYNNNNYSDQGAIGNAVTYDPTKPVMNGNTAWRGYTTWTKNIKNVDGVGVNLATPNPLAQLELTDNKSNVMRSIGNVAFDYKLHFLPDLHAKLNLAYDYSETEGHNNVADSTQWIYIPTSGCGRMENYTEKRKDELLDFYLNYTKELPVIESKIDAMGGYSWSHFYKTSTDSALTKDLTKYIKAFTEYPTEYYLVSFFGRVNYTLLDRYLLTFTLRNDGTSRFSKSSRWGLFPSAAFAWKINNEPFLRDIKAISEFKLRLGYGETGQQDLGTGNNYPYIPTFTISQDNARYQMGNKFVNTLRPNGYDDRLKWETTTTSNIGFDFGFFNGRISGSVDYYLKKTKDLISQVEPPLLSNFTNKLLTNVGNMENRGFEFTLNGKIISQKDYFWEMSYNLSYNKNKITNLSLSNDPNYASENSNSSIQGATSDLAQVNKVGYAVNSFYTYQQVYDNNGMPIEGIYVDRNNDGQINSSDLYVYQNPTADFLMGLSTRMGYKNWDLAVSGRVSLNNYVYNNVASNSSFNKMYYTLGYLSNVTRFAEKSNFNTTQYHTDFYIENASFFKIDNISTGYRFENIIKNKASLYASLTVQNVLVVTKYTGLDPEINGGMDNNFFPRTRTFIFGLRLDF